MEVTFGTNNENFDYFYFLDYIPSLLLNLDMTDIEPADFWILDNGGIVFMVEVDKNNLKVFETDRSGDEPVKIDKWRISITRFKKLFQGTDRMTGRLGNSLLVSLGNLKYMYIGSEIYTFTADEEITEYYSPVGNSSVPYPYAISKNYIYLMLENVRINNCIGDNDGGYWHHECILLNIKDRRGRRTSRANEIERKMNYIFHPYNIYYSLRESEMGMYNQPPGNNPEEHCKFDLDVKKFESDMIGITNKEFDKEFKKKKIIIDKKTRYVSRGGYTWFNPNDINNI